MEGEHLTLVGTVSKRQSWTMNPESPDELPKTVIIEHYKLTLQTTQAH